MAEEAPPLVTDTAAVAPDAPTEVTLADLLAEQKAHRAEVQALREEIAQARRAPVTPAANALSAEDALAVRMAEIDNFAYYCPGCGALYKSERECIGLRGGNPHPPIEVVSTDELKSGDPMQHTAAPSTAT